MKKKTLVMLGAVLLTSSGVQAGSPLRVATRFSLTNDAGLGHEWFVVGSHPDVGSSNPAQAIKLVWSEGDVWWGEIGVQAGTALEYKFVNRATAADQICDEANAVWWPDGVNLLVQVPAEPAAPFAGKQIEFFTDMTNVSLVYSMLSAADFSSTGAWNTVGMSLAGP